SPVRATPVTPGLLAVLQPPFFSWPSLRNAIALSTTAFHLAASTGGGAADFSLLFPPGARPPSARAQAMAAIPVQHSRLIAILSGLGNGANRAHPSGKSGARAAGRAGPYVFAAPGWLCWSAARQPWSNAVLAGAATGCILGGEPPRRKRKATAPP